MNPLCRALGVLLLLSVAAEWIADVTTPWRMTLLALFLIAFIFDMFAGSH